MILLHGGMTRGRFAYFRELINRFGLDPTNLRAVDIGCGGGFLAEQFARLGCHVVGVDPSVVSIETARRHAAAEALDIEYRVGAGESLPARDAEFDIAYCCDVLEHVSDVEQVIAETARVVKPGGLFLFDTPNRTLVSKLVLIKMMQEWHLTRFIDVPLHDWSMFVTPGELEKILSRHGFRLAETVGLGLRSKSPALLRDFVRARRGRISYGELSRKSNVGRVKSQAIAYMGVATRAPVS